MRRRTTRRVVRLDVRRLVRLTWASEWAPADRENALGWKDVGKTGTKQECLDYIEEVWTDMRPLSLRKSMEQGSETS